MDVDPPSDLVVRRQAPSVRVPYASYPPSAASAYAARQRREAMHSQRRETRRDTRGVMVPFSDGMEVEDLDERYHEDL